MPDSRNPVKRNTGICCISYLLCAEERFESVFFQVCADYAETSHDDRCACADIRFAGNIIKMDPFAVFACDDAFCTQNRTVFAFIQQFIEDVFDLTDGIFIDSFAAPADEYIICMVMTTGAFAIVMMMFVIVVMTAGTFLIVVVMFVIVVMTAGAFFIVMMMFVIVVMIAGAFFIVVMMFVVVVMIAGAFFIVAMMFVVVVMTAGTFFIVMMMFVMMVFHFMKFCFQRVLVFHRIQDLCACELIPGSCDDRGFFVDTAKKFDALMELVFVHSVCSGENDAVCMLDLIVEELTEVLHIHFALICIDDRCIAVEYEIVRMDILDSLDNVGELADARGLDEDAVGSILLENFFQRFAEIADEAAADASGVHFRNFDACILHKSAVNADFTEFVFDQHEFFTCEGFADEFLDECCFSCSEKTGEDIDLCHVINSPLEMFLVFRL